MKPDLAAHGRSRLRQLAHPDDVAPLITIAHQVADTNRWSPRQRKDAIIGVAIMLGIQVDGRGPVRSSEVEALRDIDMCVWTVIEVLSAAGALIEDRMPAIDAWFHERLVDLPDPMASELRIWFDIMKNGSRSPRRRRPRSAGSITLHMTWALPVLRQWAAAGHTSLREITRDHVYDAIPAIGVERPTSSTAASASTDAPTRSLHPSANDSPPGWTTAPNAGPRPPTTTCSSTSAASTAAVPSAPDGSDSRSAPASPHDNCARTESSPRPTPTAATSAPSPTSSASASAHPVATPTPSTRTTSHPVREPTVRPTLGLTTPPSSSSRQHRQNS